MSNTKLERQIWETIEHRIFGQLRNSVRDHVERQVAEQTEFQIFNQLWYAVGAEIWDRSYPIKEQIKLQAKEDYSDRQ